MADKAVCVGGANATKDLPAGDVIGTSDAQELTNKLLGDLSAKVGVIAAAGSAQEDAAEIVTPVALVTGADGTKGVVLPAAAANTVIIVKNTVAATHALKVYPAADAKIDGGNADTAIDLAAGKGALFVAKDGTDWYTLLGA